MPDPSLPPCCHPSEGASTAEQLYCAYQRGGPPERAGLAWNDAPCPTWGELLERAQGGDEGAQGVISKWETVASYRWKPVGDARVRASISDGTDLAGRKQRLLVVLDHNDPGAQDELSRQVEDLRAGRVEVVINAWEGRVQNFMLVDVEHEEVKPSDEQAVMSPEDAQRWEDFRSRDGLLWWVNRSLTIFGYALVARYDEEGRLFAVAPERVPYRGFSLESEEHGFMRLTQMMQREAASLVADVEAEDD